MFEQSVFHALAETYIGKANSGELMKMSLTRFRTLRAIETQE